MSIPRSFNGGFEFEMVESETAVGAPPPQSAPVAPGADSATWGTKWKRDSRKAGSTIQLWPSSNFFALVNTLFAKLRAAALAFLAACPLDRPPCWRSRVNFNHLQRVWLKTSDSKKVIISLLIILKNPVNCRRRTSTSKPSRWGCGLGNQGAHFWNQYKLIDSSYHLYAPAIEPLWLTVHWTKDFDKLPDIIFDDCLHN